MSQGYAVIKLSEPVLNPRGKSDLGVHMWGAPLEYGWAAVEFYNPEDESIFAVSPSGADPEKSYGEAKRIIYLSIINVERVEATFEELKARGSMNPGQMIDALVYPHLPEKSKAKMVNKYGERQTSVLKYAGKIESAEVDFCRLIIDAAESADVDKLDNLKDSFPKVYAKLALQIAVILERNSSLAAASATAAAAYTETVAASWSEELDLLAQLAAAQAEIARLKGLLGAEAPAAASGGGKVAAVFVRSPAESDLDAVAAPT